MRSQDRDQSKDLNIDQIELKGFSRSLTEIEFLLLILVILYTSCSGHYGNSRAFLDDSFHARLRGLRAWL